VRLQRQGTALALVGNQNSSPNVFLTPDGVPWKKATTNVRRICWNAQGSSAWTCRAGTSTFTRSGQRAPPDWRALEFRSSRPNDSWGTRRRC